MAHALRDRFSDIILKIARKMLATVDNAVFSNDYEGSAKAGAVKIPVRNTEVSVRDYDTTNGLAPEMGTTTYLTITIGNDKAINEIIDNYEAAAVPDNLAAQRAESAGYSMGLNLDTDAITTLEAEGTTETETTQSTSTTAWGYFLDSNQALDEADIPRDGMRYALVSPNYHRLVKENIVAVSEAGLGDNIISSGAIGTLDGVPVWMSNNMDAGTEFIVGHMGWSQRILEYTVPVALKDLTNNYIGSSAVQGRYVYEHAVTKATAVRVKTFV